MLVYVTFDDFSCRNLSRRRPGRPSGQKVRSSRPLEAKVALRGAPEVPKRMAEDSLRQALGSPRNAVGSIFGIKKVPRSDVDDFGGF